MMSSRPIPVAGRSLLGFDPQHCGEVALRATVRAAVDATGGL